MSEHEGKHKSNLPAIAGGIAAALGGAYGGKKLIDHVVKARRTKGLKIIGGLGLGYTGLAAGIAALRKHTDKMVGGIAHTPGADNASRKVLSMVGKKVHNIPGRGASRAERSLANERVLKKLDKDHIRIKEHKREPAKVLDFEEARKRKMEKLSSIMQDSSSFWSGFEKRASGWGTAAELGGLGTLAIPSIQELRGKPMDEKTKARLEVLGLGTLAAPYAGQVAKGAKNLAKKIL